MLNQSFQITKYHLKRLLAIRRENFFFSLKRKNVFGQNSCTIINSYTFNKPKENLSLWEIHNYYFADKIIFKFKIIKLSSPKFFINTNHVIVWNTDPVTCDIA